MLLLVDIVGADEEDDVAEDVADDVAEDVADDVAEDVADDVAEEELFSILVGESNLTALESHG